VNREGTKYDRGQYEEKDAKQIHRSELGEKI